MSTTTTIDAVLRVAGWGYDVGEEQVFDGDKRLHDRKVLALVPAMTLDELASYQDDRYDRLAKRRTVKTKAAKKVMRKKG